MKTFGTIIAILVLVLLALGLRSINQTREKTHAALALQAANDKIAEQQRAQAAARALRAPAIDLPIPPAVETAAPPAPQSVAAPPLVVSRASLLGPDPVEAALVGFDAAAFFSGSGPATAQDLSRASLQVLQTARNYEVYTSNFSGLNRLLGALSAVSNAILQDDGSNPARTASVQKNFSLMLDDSIALTRSIAARPVETPETVQQSQQLEQMLSVIKARQGL